MTLDPNGMLSAAPDVIAAFVGDEAVLLSQTRGVYYGLNEIAARAWRQLERGATLQDLHRVLIAEYDVEGSRLRHDLERLVGEWIAFGLVTPPLSQPR